MTELNVTPLMDLAFSLLIIFMISTPLLEQTIPVHLPKQDKNLHVMQPFGMQYETLPFRKMVIFPYREFHFSKAPLTWNQFLIPLPQASH